MLMLDHPSLVFPAGEERMRSYLREPDIPSGIQSLWECSLSAETLSPLISDTIYLRFDTHSKTTENYLYCITICLPDVKYLLRNGD